MRLAPHTDGMKKGSSWEGCALPNPPAGGGRGKPGFPLPLFESLCSPQPSMRLTPHTDGMKKGSSWEGCALPHPPAGGLRPHPPAGRGVGKPGFPTPLFESLCSPQVPCAGRTTPRWTYGCPWEGCALPHPPTGGGMGKPGFPSPAGRGRGETWFPHTPAPATYVHVSPPCGSRRTPMG